MLLETVFRVGGVVTIVLGGLLVLAYVLTGAGAEEPGLYATIVPFFVVGGLFLYVGRDAERDRRQLMRLGDRSEPEAAPDPRYP